MTRARRAPDTARLRLLTAVGLLAMLAACGGTPADSTSVDSTPTDSTPTQSTPADGSSASAQASPTEAASPSASSVATIAPDADLATLLPTTVAGSEYTVTGYSGTDAAGLSLGRVGAVAQNLDPPVTDIDAAIAVGPNWDANLGPEVLAVRFPDADASAVVDLVPPAFGGIQYASGTIEVTDEEIDGRTVSVMEVPMMSGGGTSTYYFYALGDVLFLVNAADRAVAEDALSQLP